MPNETPTPEGASPGQPERESESRPGRSDSPTEPTGNDAEPPADDGVEPPAGAEPPSPETTGGGDGPPDARSSEFGEPGRPLGRSAFVLGFTGGLGLLLAYSAFLAIRSATSILILIFVSMFLAVGLNPAVARLQRWGLPRGLGVTIVSLSVVLVLCAGISALVPPLIAQVNQLVDSLPTYIDELQRSKTISRLNEQYDLIQKLQSVATMENLANAAGGVLGGAQLVFGAIFNLLTVSVLTIYFMAAFDRLRRGAYLLVPASRRERVQLIGDEILDKVGAYMAGALIIALLAGVSTWAFLFFAGVVYPFALAVVVALTDLIPQIGAMLGAVVVCAVGFASSSVGVGIACVVFFVIYQQVENFLIYPRVMRHAVKVSDLAAIIAALLGVALLGVIGALIAIPAVAAIQLIGREVLLPRQQRS
ncbi:MAG: AI-2E family transporter [Micromonosporaceae bacterium]